MIFVLALETTLILRLFFLDRVVFGIVRLILSEVNVGHSHRGVLAKLLVRDAQRVIRIRLNVAVSKFLSIRQETGLAMRVG